MSYPLPQGRGRDLRHTFVVQKWSPGGICHTIPSGDRRRADSEAVVRTDYTHMPTRNEEGVDRSCASSVIFTFLVCMYELTAAQEC